MLPLILNTNLIKGKSKIGYPLNRIWDLLDWKRAVITTTTLCSSAIPIRLGITLETFHFPETVNVLRSHPHPSPRVASTPNRTKTNHHLLNHVPTLHTYTHTLSYATSLTVGLREALYPWCSKRKPWTHLPSSFHMIKTRKRKIKL